MLANQALYHLSHAFSPFYFSYFADRVSQFSPGTMDWPGPQSSYLCLLYSWNDRQVLVHLALLIKMKVSLFSRLPLNCHPLISTPK
jgi:hypothetical protein